MSNNFYTTKTAALKATTADIRNLNAQEIKLKDKNILDYIKESTPTIKHSQDTRETVTENDLWGQWIETTEDGTIIVHDDWVTNPNASVYEPWNASITKIENDKAYINDTVYANIQLERLKDGAYMFGMSNAIGMAEPSLTSFTGDLSNLTTAPWMFHRCWKLTSFSTSLPNLRDGNSMFNSCNQLGQFTVELPSLEIGTDMFQSCDNLTSFSSNLPSLMYAYSMFTSCYNLTSFSSDLPSLTTGDYMFRYCSNLESFSSDLPNLTSGHGMFYLCSELKSFSSDLSSLTDGSSMFSSCANLSTFTSDLSSLIAGAGMFLECKLDAQSVMYIAESIKDIAAEKQLYSDGIIPYVTVDKSYQPYPLYSASNGFMSDGTYIYTSHIDGIYTSKIKASQVGILTLGIDVVNDPDTIGQQLQTFAEDATFNNWDELKQFFVDKGWTVTFQYGGTDTTITLSDDEQFRGTPIYARLIEVLPEGEEYTEEEKASAEYCTEDGTKYYNIDWGHDVTHPDEFQYFGSLLEACGYYGVIPKKYLEEV